MAEEAKKPTTRKTPVRKPPTRAAALKALGLTKEDLEILAKAKEPTEVSVEQVPKSQARSRNTRDIVPPDSVEDSTLDSVLTDGLTGKTIDKPKAINLRLERANELSKSPERVLRDKISALETRLAEADINRPATVDAGLHRVLNEIRFGEKEPKGTAVYARNNMYSPFRFKTESGKQYNLAPRGFRGDFKVVHKDDLEDSNILDNANRGLIELLTREEADQVITKQHTNATSSDHLKAFIRTPTGEEYAPDAFKVATEEEVQGITVASTQELNKLQENGKGVVNWNEVHNPTDQVKSDDPYAGMSEDQRLDALDKATRQGGNPLAGLKVSIG